MLICLNDLFACSGLAQTRKLLTNFSKNSFYLLPEPLRLGEFLTNYCKNGTRVYILYNIRYCSLQEKIIFKSNGYNNIKLHHNNFFRFRCSLINLYKKQSGTLLNSNTKNKLFVKFLATK